MGLGLRDDVATPSKAAVDLDEMVQSGAKWFYWIVGFSVASTVAQLFGVDWGSIVGLGITRVFDAVASAIAADSNGGALGSYARGISLGLDVIVYAVFLVLGWLAGRKYSWAFVAGMVFYGLDTLVFLLAQGWLSVLVHAVVLSRIWTGFSSLRKLRAGEAAASLPIAPGSVAVGATEPQPVDK